ncbi:MAG TPA: pantoate--beta-alanine ligase [Dehalococcoidia bacterium]
MIVEPRIDGVRAWRRSLSGSVGVVPTMGYLHEGHISLVDRARAENDHVAVTIFVNPTQFGPREDLASYPRDLDGDLRLLEQTGVDLVFTPEAAEVYPPDFDTWVDPGGIANRLEGSSRPGHFRGVATVVLKLLNIIAPDRAYFGQKDAQQLRVIKQMVRDLNVPVNVIGLPIVREADGLAMSSRNAYLSDRERQAALVLSQALRRVAEALHSGVTDARQLRGLAEALINAQPLASLEYVSVADGETLDELEAADTGALVSLAVRIGKTRLIDNVSLGASVTAVAR